MQKNPPTPDTVTFFGMVKRGEVRSKIIHTRMRADGTLYGSSIQSTKKRERDLEKTNGKTVGSN